MKNEITIKKEFSIYNKDCIQFIIKMSNDETWSVVQIQANWDIVKCYLNSTEDKIIETTSDNYQFTNLDDLREFIFNFTNKKG